jgi:hypothetical protein
MGASDRVIKDKYFHPYHVRWKWCQYLFLINGILEAGNAAMAMKSLWIARLSISCVQFLFIFRLERCSNSYCN